MTAQAWERSRNPHQPHPFSTEYCETQFRYAVSDCAGTFGKHTRKLGHLSPRFWVALLDLELAVDRGTGEDLIRAFPGAYRYLGAPGDFGYGTPCGDVLRNLYDWWNAWLTARKSAEPVPV